MVVGSPARLRAHVTVKLVCVITGDEFAGYAMVTPGELMLQVMAADSSGAMNAAANTQIQRMGFIGSLPCTRADRRARSRRPTRAPARGRTRIPVRSP